MLVTFEEGAATVARRPQGEVAVSAHRRNRVSQRGARRTVAALAAVLALVLTACADWPMSGHDAARTHANPLERALSAANIGQAARAWGGYTNFGGPVTAPPVVAKGFAYVSEVDGTLDAFAIGDTSKCGGIPTGCIPAWRATLPGTTLSSPTVADGLLVVGASDGRLYTFDATGVTNCAAGPYVPICQPLRTYVLGGQVGSPAVVDGVVFATGGANGRTLGAFRADGTVGCSGTPRTCVPLWTAPLGGRAADPTIAANRVYVGAADGTLATFDAGGSAGCGGTPKICSPLWTATLGGPSDTISTAAYAAGTVYVTGSNGRLFALDAAGTTNCAGAPTVCSPLWRSSPGLRGVDPAVADGRVYASDASGAIEVFDATGSGCSGSPKTCTARWSTTPGPAAASPAVANGLLYVGRADATVQAFDATGSAACAGTPVVCAPLWTTSGGNQFATTPAIANGAVYVGIGGSTSLAKLVSFSIAPPRVVGFGDEGTYPLVGLLGEHFTPSTPGTATVVDTTRPGQPSASTSLVTRPDGTFSIGVDLEHLCFDRMHATVTVGSVTLEIDFTLTCNFP
jgi:PQQ-like domain